jgi:hypothetical protein
MSHNISANWILQLIEEMFAVLMDIPNILKFILGAYVQGYSALEFEAI